MNAQIIPFPKKAKPHPVPVDTGALKLLAVAVILAFAAGLAVRRQ